MYLHAFVFTFLNIKSSIMFFYRYSTINSKKNANALGATFLGQHLKIHDLDFEISEKGGDIKVIPHAENDDHVHTLPITRIRITSKGDQSVIKVRSKPRRIDIGGPYLLMTFISFSLIAAGLLFAFGQGKYNSTIYIIAGAAFVMFGLLWLRLEQGYFDYIRKIRKWVIDNA